MKIHCIAIRKNPLEINIIIIIQSKYFSVSDWLKSHAQFIAPAGRNPEETSLSLRVYVEKNLQLKYAVATKEKISICLIGGHMESLSNKMMTFHLFTRPSKRFLRIT